MEKHTELPTVAPTAPTVQRSPRSSSGRRFSLFVVAFCIALWLNYPDIVALYRRSTVDYPHGAKDDSALQCPQPKGLLPSHDNEKLNQTYTYLSSQKFLNASVARLQGAVRVRTESFDDLGPIGEDPRWDVFYKFADYLESAYPLVHEKLKLEKINTHGLLYTWQGTDETLKPTLLMGHQDVVPVPDATVDQWTHPPFDAVFDGEYIWGRGADDCKNQLTAILEAVEHLLSAGFSPQRTVLLSFGFDEEVSGAQGAGHLGRFLLSRYGHNGIEVLVDEGEGYTRAFGRGFAMLGVAEKGYIDVDITVRAGGGHSSIPTDHTSIGILSEIITRIEASPYPTYLSDRSPYLTFLHCGAEHAPAFPKKLRHLLSSRRSSSSSSPSCAARHSDPLAHEAARLGGRPARYLMQTSQAVDLISGGAKVNALPETASATVNHRINIGDAPDTVRRHLSALVGPIARAYNLSTSFFPEIENGTGDASSSSSSSSRSEGLSGKTISLRARHSIREVAPITPVRGPQGGKGQLPYDVVAGTVRGVFEAEVEGGVVVAPALMTGNTDTLSYWEVTRHIFRFAPGQVGQETPGLGNIHTVDEHVAAANHVRAVKWFTMFVRNMDEARIGE